MKPEIVLCAMTLLAPSTRPTNSTVALIAVARHPAQVWCGMMDTDMTTIGFANVTASHALLPPSLVNTVK